MVSYSCSVCNFQTVYKTNYKKHCQTKKHLRNIEKHEKNNICCEIKEVNTKESVLKPNKSQIYTCNFCYKTYSTNGNLDRHLKNCKVKKSDLEEDYNNDAFKIFEEKLLLLRSKKQLVTKSSQNINTNNDTNNITNNNTNNITNNNTNNITNNIINNIITNKNTTNNTININITNVTLTNDIIDFIKFLMYNIPASVQTIKKTNNITNNILNINITNINITNDTINIIESFMSTVPSFLKNIDKTIENNKIILRFIYSNDCEVCINNLIKTLCLM